MGLFCLLTDFRYFQGKFHHLPLSKRKISTEISPSHSVPKLRYRPPLSDYKIFFYSLQNHSKTLFKICINECLMNLYCTLNFIFLQCSKDEILTPHTIY